MHVLGWLSLFLACCFVAADRKQEATSKFWSQSASKEMQKILSRKPNTKVARNVIAFLGDGMGIPTITAARISKGQSLGQSGEEGKLVFEEFPDVALIKTYNVDRQVPDSAGTATAIFSGVKTNYEMLGVTAAAKPKDCESSVGQEISSILQWAQEAGKDTGIVTTTRLTHATPASLYSHLPYRYWENDVEMKNETCEYKDIARQMVEDAPGKNVKVIFGGGRRNFLSKNNGDKYQNLGLREDSRNLIDVWSAHKTDLKAKSEYITTKEQLQAADPAKIDYLLGIFSDNHLDYVADGTKVHPSLAEMTMKAIQFLQKSENGFFLMVEGGRIDHAHHDNRAGKALAETVAFDEAIDATLKLVDTQSDTLVLVTADHSHVMTINGYPVRGNPILGIGDTSDQDNLPYTTLMYTTGPAASENVKEKRERLREDKAQSNNVKYRQATMVPSKDETHGGEDVAVYAIGPMSHLFNGVQEQSYIAHAMAYASCVGDDKTHCNHSTTLKQSLQLLLSSLVFLRIYTMQS